MSTSLGEVGENLDGFGHRFVEVQQNSNVLEIHRVLGSVCSKEADAKHVAVAGNDSALEGVSCCLQAFREVALANHFLTSINQKYGTIAFPLEQVVLHLVLPFVVRHIKLPLVISVVHIFPPEYSITEFDFSTQAKND